MGSIVLVGSGQKRNGEKTRERDWNRNGRAFHAKL